MAPCKDPPSIEEVREKVKTKFGFEPCLYQIQDAQAQLRGEHCITIAATGSGKTLTFWIPLLFTRGIIVLITALNILGDQNVNELTALGIPAVNITKDTASDSTFKVRSLTPLLATCYSHKIKGHCGRLLLSNYCQPGKHTTRFQIWCSLGRTQIPQQVVRHLMR